MIMQTKRLGRSGLILSILTVLVVFVYFQCINKTGYPRIIDGLNTSEYSSARNTELFDKILDLNLSHDDPALIKGVQTFFLKPPSGKVFKPSAPLFKTKQAEAVRRILNNKKRGFFVECGALDGERASNTITLERNLGWTGLLVEMDPSYFLQLSGKNRNAYIINACLAINPYHEKVRFFEMSGGWGQLISDKPPRGGNFKVAEPVHCFPLYTLLLALNRTHIDYFSLDVEGFELKVLKTIPWSKVTIDVISVEYSHGKKNEYVKYMESIGYDLHSKVIFRDAARAVYADDYMFVRKSKGPGELLTNND